MASWLLVILARLTSVSRGRVARSTPTCAVGSRYRRPSFARMWEVRSGLQFERGEEIKKKQRFGYRSDLDSEALQRIQCCQRTRRLFPSQWQHFGLMTSRSVGCNKLSLDPLHDLWLFKFLTVCSAPPSAGRSFPGRSSSSKVTHRGKDDAHCWWAEYPWCLGFRGRVDGSGRCIKFPVQFINSHIHNGISQCFHLNSLTRVPWEVSKCKGNYCAYH